MWRACTAELPVLRDYDHCTYFKYDAGTSAGWRLRAARPAVGRWRAFPMTSPSARSPATSSISSPCSWAPCAACRRWRGRHPKVLLRPGKLHPGRALSSGRGAGTGRTASWRRDLIPLACSRRAASAKSCPSGSATDTRRTTCGKSTSAATMPFQTNRSYLQERVTESLGLLYATHWPFRQYESARGVRKSPLHDRLARGTAPASARLSAGSAPTGMRRRACRPRTSTAMAGRTGSSRSAANIARCATRVGTVRPVLLRQISPRRSPTRCSVLNQVCANDVAVAPGSMCLHPVA